MRERTPEEEEMIKSFEELAAVQEIKRLEKEHKKLMRSMEQARIQAMKSLEFSLANGRTGNRKDRRAAEAKRRRAKR